MKNSFIQEAANDQHPKWKHMIDREHPLYARNFDIRSEFQRDHTRIIHSTAYRRMKHKTQVFYSPSNDHICTRIEHVTYVESISYTIANYLGLNTELTRAIAIAHDLGHSPFGHQGEKILSDICQEELGISFWHENNSLHMVDDLELLDDPEGNKQNLNLTYSVRDGIISHCGEIDENSLKPREEAIDLHTYQKPNQFAPYTWEGCVVKMADKISYLGRDMMDAITLGILEKDNPELQDIMHATGKVVNNTNIINDLIYDVCQYSSLENGLCFSKPMFETVNQLKRFNYQHIYLSHKVTESIPYFELILHTIYTFLKDSFRDREKTEKICPIYIKDFYEWLMNYWDRKRNDYNHNRILFHMDNEQDLSQAIIYFISGMTDNYAIHMYNQIIGF